MSQEWSLNGLIGGAVFADTTTPTETASPAPTVPPTESNAPTGTAPSTESETPTETAESTPPSAQSTAPPVTDPQETNQDKYQGRKLIALTFDDGPDSKYTPQILDILKKYDAKATFFVVGLQVAKNPDVARRIIKEGHTIGNHSWSHSDLTKLSEKKLKAEIEKTQQAVVKATGIAPELVRAPYGAYSDKVLKSIRLEHMKHVYWTVDTRDWAGTSVSDMRKNVLTNAHKGGVILMHSFGGRKHAIEHTIELLPSIIEELGDKGYEFVTVEELIESGQFHSSIIK
ncbi:polysaccharide deacetylase family protein [Cohnella luojiensis]|uniref:Polysaccharide deacetylase family protein n=2 Tax=Cohnella luojiensis TaxID=652876 RepID=A0A4Y8LU72_9BACL|nr:polysaccharide deacetylase family protein [Cohnella luojiensis]